MAGARRTGKTSVCEAALARAARRGRLHGEGRPVPGRPTQRELAEALAAAVIANRSAAHRGAQASSQRGPGRAFRRPGAERWLRMVAELGEGVEVAITPGLAAQDPERALDLALELPERVARATGSG